VAENPKPPDWLVPLSKPSQCEMPELTVIGSHERLALEVAKRLLEPRLAQEESKVPVDEFQAWLVQWLADRPQASDKDVLNAADGYFGPRGQFATREMVRTARHAGGRRRGRKPVR
jgi:hypothetical protein